MPDHETEHHPSFGWAQVNVVSGSTHLFDSEISHQHFVELRLSHAERERHLNRDWIRSRNDTIVTVRMSMAQWGALVSSFGSSGVPVTIGRLDGKPVEPVPHEPRLAHSVAEVEGAVDKLLEDLKDRVRNLRDGYDRKAGRKEMAELLRSVEIGLGNARANASVAAESLTEHVENVVTKAKYDIESQVQLASQRGLDATGMAGELLAGD